MGDSPSICSSTRTKCTHEAHLFFDIFTMLTIPACHKGHSTPGVFIYPIFFFLCLPIKSDFFSVTSTSSTSTLFTYPRGEINEVFLHQRLMHGHTTGAAFIKHTDQEFYLAGCRIACRIGCRIFFIMFTHKFLMTTKLLSTHALTQHTFIMEHMHVYCTQLKKCKRKWTL